MACMKVVLFLVVLSLPLCLHARTQQLPKVDAIYQFGDSISDTGNLIRESLGQFTTFARPPYGQTYFHKPTGRCSDGLLMIDFFAKYFKLPFLDAYLDEAGNFAHGVNFAVAGSTALNSSTLAAKNITSPVSNSSLSVQLGWFRSHLHSLCPNPSDCKAKLVNSLFIIETGGNDFNYAFFGQKSLADVQQMVDEVVQTITSSVKEVIGYGATRVVVPGNFAIGCMPIYLSAFKTNDTTMYDELHCLNQLNEFATYQNDRLQDALNELQKQYPNVAIVYSDYFNALKGLIQHASSHGFDKDEVQKTCCGIGDNEYNFDINRMCGTPGATVCSDPHKSVSWDGVHMTQHAYRVLAKGIFEQIVRGISN